MGKNVIIKEKRLCIVCGEIKKWEEFRPNGDRTPKRVCKSCSPSDKNKVFGNLDSYEIKLYEKILLESGKPPFNHRDVNHKVNQACLKCGKIKPLDDFRIRNDKQKKNPYRVHTCRVCEAYYTSKWRKLNPDKALEYRKYYSESGKARENYINLAHRNLKNHLYLRAKHNAKSRNLDFNLELKDIIIPDKCHYLEIPLINNVGKNSKALKDSYSIDRIDSSKGYIKGNIQIISRLANVMKNEASIEELIRFCKNALKIHNSQGEDIV